MAQIYDGTVDPALHTTDEDDRQGSWIWRTLQALEAWARPAWGWGVFAGCMLLAMLPAISIRTNRWLTLGNYQTTLELVGPLAVVCVWWLWGWRNETRRKFGWVAPWVTLLIGLILISQLVLGWIPGPRVLWYAATTGDWAQVPNFGVAAWIRAYSRFVLWGEGISAGGAAQDNLVFATFGAMILWLLGVATAWLARGQRQGLAAGAPSLWLLGLILLYSSSGRFLLLSGLALTFALHILLDQGVLTQRWQQLQLDYSPGLMLDRVVAVIGAGAIVLTLAAVMPNLYVRPLVDRYYALLAPVHLAMEEFGERLFPELRGTSRLRGAGGSGMPNDFLLRGGPDLGNAPVMRVRTDEAPTFALPYDEFTPPPGHYMRGRTLTVYDGRGWSNPINTGIDEVAANRRWDESATWGRKPLVQSVILDVSTSILFAAPEPVEASADVRLEARGMGDLVTVQARESSYTIVSMVPAVNEEMLRGLHTWTVDGATGNGDAPVLPAPLTVHLELPDTVSERTRALAQQLTEEHANSYDKAFAIEQYLRQYVYDLEVPEPPNDVTDVADYFLFELQRGYCDYYATAFIVLARLAGLPTRFATGFSAGQWNPAEGVFLISENNAHSWPEVYFPEVGWIPFEPTAARAQMQRVALPQLNTSAAPPPVVAATPVVEASQRWNWQQVVWLIPLVGILWLAWRGWTWWWRRREDPWQAVLQWGQRAGRPMDAGETVLEYGKGLAGFILRRQTTTPDAGRIAAREIELMSEEVNRLRYAQLDERPRASGALAAHWARLRPYLRLVRIG